MRIARMRRSAEIEPRWGTIRYEMTLALYLWIVYHLLGKLETMLIVLRKPG